MYRDLNFVIILLMSLAYSCKGQDEVNIKLSIHNKSATVLDSLLVYNVEGNETMYYNVKLDTIIVKIYNHKKASIPKGESSVFSLVAFDENYFWTMHAGFIGFPTAMLKDEYEFYIWDKYVTNTKDFEPADTDHRQNLKEFIR